MEIHNYMSVNLQPIKGKFKMLLSVDGRVPNDTHN